MTPEQRIVGACLIATRETLSAGIAQIDAALTAMGFDVGLPERDHDAGCPHDATEDLSSMGEESLYRCTKCGETKSTPFEG